MRRTHLSILAAAVVALLAGLLPWNPPTAAAITPPATPEQVLGDVNLLFSRGGTPARYPANSVVRVDAGNINFVKGCVPGPNGEGFPDFIQPSADLYIVPSGRTFRTGDALSDALGAPNTVWAGLGGSFLWEPLAITGAAGSDTGLPSGTYDVVVDECQNARWDTGQDSVVRDAFVVDIDQEVPGFDYEIAEFRALKARADRQLGQVSQVESIFVQILVLEAKERAEQFLSVGFGLIGGVTATAKALIGLFDPSAQLKNWGKSFIKNSAQKRRATLINLRDDPPDPNFQQFASPVRTADTVAAPFPTLDDAAAWGNVNDAIAAVEEAFVRALERYQGAQAVGNVAWAARHARSLDELASLHAELTAAQPAFAQELVDRYDFGGGTVADQNELNLILQRIGSFSRGYENDPVWWNSGLSVAETEAAIEAFIAEMVTMPPTFAEQVVFQVPNLSAAAVADAEFSSELRAWVDAAVPGVLAELDAVVNPLAADPTVAIAPVTGAAAGATTTLSVELPADYVADSIRWDLDGDGVFDDATGAAPDWVVPGNARAGVPYVIAVEVAGGLTADIAYQVVVPVAGNLPPTVELIAPVPVVGVPGVTTTLEVGVADPEGGPVTVEWFVDGVATGATGTTYDVAVPANFFGQIDVVALATDAAGATAIEIVPVSVRSGVDDDLDGFFAAPGPDCDDGAGGRFVNPIAAEIVGNGIDDDCDPSTGDGGSDITTSLPTIRGFRGVEGDEYNFELSSWNHPNKLAGQEFTVTVEWGDGTTSTQTVSGTTSADTTFSLSHRYVDELAEGDLRWCVSNGADPDGCGELIGAIEIDNEPPFVGAADLRTWSVDDASSDPRQCRFPPNCDGQTAAGNGADWSVDAGGGSARTNANSSEYLVLHSPVQLSEGGYGRAMVELSVLWPNGDDDNIGLVVGYEPGDLLGSTGAEDFVDFEWLGRGRGIQFGENNLISCRNPNAVDEADNDELIDTATISRTRGPATTYERVFNVVLDAVDPAGDPVNPLCQDEFGVDELEVLAFESSDLRTDSTGRWLQRATERSNTGGPTFGPIERPYTFTVDYRPDRLRMWTANGSLVADVAPRDAGSDPFPPGGLGLFSRSQDSLRAKGTAPELEFAFTQGTPGAITMPFTDAGDDEWTAIVNWGDGSSQSFGTIGDNPTGAGWYDVTASHTYSRAGDFRGEVCVIDDLDEGSCFTFRAVVDNLPPVVEAGPDIDAAPDLVSGATLSLEQASFTDPGTNDDHTATIDWGDGTPLAAGTVEANRSTGGVVTGTHTYAADGVYEVEVCVTDQAGGVGCDTLDVDVRVVNQAPVASVEAPTEELINVEVLLGGGFTDPNPDDTHTMTIDPGDGTGVQPLPFQSGDGVGTGGIGHVYAAPGTYTVTACVTDAAGERDCADTEFEALDDGTANQPPVADPGGPYVVDEGTTVTLDASGSSDPEGGDVTIAWDVDGDGSYETPGATLDVAADDGPGSISIEFEVCDAEALCAVGTAVVQISGVAPTITTLDVGISGSSADASVSFTDPSPTDTHTVVVDWGDGSPTSSTESSASGGGTVSVTHTYAPGTWTVVATVTDDDGDETFETAQVVIAAPNRTPAADAGGPYTVSEGSTVTLDGSGSSDPDGDPVTLGWDVDGDGAFGDAPLFAGVDGPATRTVTVQACDPSGACDTDTAVVTVSNLAPIVDDPVVTVDGLDVMVAVTFADPGAADTHTVVVDWGDGSTPSEQSSSTAGGASLDASHTYEPGTWDGQVTVTDNDGGTTSRAFRVVASASSTSTSSTSTSSTSTTSPASSTSSVPTSSVPTSSVPTSSTSTSTTSTSTSSTSTSSTSSTSTTSTTIAAPPLPGTGQNSTGMLLLLAVVLLLVGAGVALMARLRT